jgi:hypothetical protein
MTPEEELHGQLLECVQDVTEFLYKCANNIQGIPEKAMISSVSQYLTLVRKILRNRTDENSCVSSMDVLESQISAFRYCLQDLEEIHDRLNREDRLN